VVGSSQRKAGTHVRNYRNTDAFSPCRGYGAHMDDHIHFILRRIDEDIRRTTLVLGQLHLHVAELPFDRSVECRQQIRRTADELARRLRIRGALLEPNPGSFLH
jgi:hypothetical protein